MNELEHKQSTVESDFERCHENFREAAVTLLYAIQEHKPVECAGFYDSLTPVHQKMNTIRDEITAAKRKERAAEIAKRMPEEGADAVIDLCPCPHDGETWLQIGEVLVAWHDDDQRVEDAVWAVVEITRSLTNEENDRYWSDDSWIGAKFVCRLSYRGDDWRAIWPANDRAREQWGCDEADE